MLFSSPSDLETTPAAPLPHGTILASSLLDESCSFKLWLFSVPKDRGSCSWSLSTIPPHRGSWHQALGFPLPPCLSLTVLLLFSLPLAVQKLFSRPSVLLHEELFYKQVSFWCVLWRRWVQGLRHLRPEPALTSLSGILSISISFSFFFFFCDFCLVHSFGTYLCVLML